MDLVIKSQSHFRSYRISFTHNFWQHIQIFILIFIVLITWHINAYLTIKYSLFKKRM
jgi:hypothetical protein